MSDIDSIEADMSDVERYQLFEQGAEAAQRADWERDQFHAFAVEGNPE